MGLVVVDLAHVGYRPQNLLMRYRCACEEFQPKCAKFPSSGELCICVCKKCLQTTIFTQNASNTLILTFFAIWAMFSRSCLQTLEHRVYYGYGNERNTHYLA